MFKNSSLIMLIFLCNLAFSQIDTSDYFPLRQGNYWEYHGRHLHQEGDMWLLLFAFSTKKYIEILDSLVIADTIVFNVKIVNTKCDDIFGGGYYDPHPNELAIEFDSTIKCDTVDSAIKAIKKYHDTIYWPEGFPSLGSGYPGLQEIYTRLDSMHDGETLQLYDGNYGLFNLFKHRLIYSNIDTFNILHDGKKQTIKDAAKLSLMDSSDIGYYIFALNFGAGIGYLCRKEIGSPLYDNGIYSQVGFDEILYRYGNLNDTPVKQRLKSSMVRFMHPKKARIFDISGRYIGNAGGAFLGKPNKQKGIFIITGGSTDKIAKIGLY